MPHRRRRQAEAGFRPITILHDADFRRLCDVLDAPDLRDDPRFATYAQRSGHLEELTGRVTAARDDERLRAEARARWRAVRAGAYPPWDALFALRPLLALALPGALRRPLRRALGR